MDSQDNNNKRMCGAEYSTEFYDDCFGDIPNNILDCAVESLDGDGLSEDWANLLGPIPSDLFPEMLPLESGVGDSSADMLGGTKLEGYGPQCEAALFKKAFKSQLKPPTSSKGTNSYLYPKFFEAPSPDSVLERRSSSSTGKSDTAISTGTQLSYPARARTKRLRSVSTINPWSRSLLLTPLPSVKKKRRVLSQQSVDVNKKCSHCEITKTPQWREGPMGPKTLCNACGVRYRSGRLFPEYRPAASPTFIPSLHSNSHRKVIEMRQKGAGINDSYVVKKPWSSNLAPTRLSS
uniref:GATA transcription factor 11-like n=1 Tax=Erigeron canadensis TaxID=72917 RepID=UPI001CB8DF5D|nr:GATA transcription factor 11-like [Erigeron canadensis]